MSADRSRPATRPASHPAPPGRSVRPSSWPVDQVAALSRLLSAPLAAAGFDLEEVGITRAGQRHVVAVAVDRDGGVDLDAVADASRVVAAALDDDAVSLPTALDRAYTLEVTSRGVGAPLTAPRHWRRAVGRLVEVRRRGVAAVTGRVTAADDDGAELATPTGSVGIDYAAVTGALVQVEFSRPGQPADDAVDQQEEGS